MSTAPSATVSSRQRPALVAVGVSLLLAAAKGAAFLLTGSLAMLASAADSAGDALVSAGNLMAIRAAARPPDRGHPYGHGKLESVAAQFQGLLLMGAGAAVGVQAALRVTSPEPISRFATGLVVALASMVASLALARYMRRAGRRLDSPAVEADSAHYGGDYLVNLGVVLALLADHVFGLPQLDPLISVVIAAVIVHAGYQVFLGAVHALMDRSLGNEVEEAVHKVVADHAPEVRGYHDLLSRRSGPDRFIELHLEIDDTLTFRAAHDLGEKVAADIRARVPRAQVTVHTDPWPEKGADASTHRPHAPESRV